MSIPLRYNTASQEVPLGFFLDSTDGNTEETGLTISNTDIKLWKNGATSLASKNSGGATHISNGIYYAVLDATDTNTIGPLVIFVHISGALAVRVECIVLPAEVFDYLCAAAGTDYFKVDVTQIASAAVDASAAQLGVNVVNWKGSAAAAMTGDAYARIGTNGAGLTAIGDSRIANLDAAVSSRSTLTAQQVWEYTARTLTSFGTLVSDIASAVWGAATRTLSAFGFTVNTASDANVTAIKAKTDNLPADPASDTQVNTRLSASSYTAPDNASIVAIKAKTDQLTFTVANRVDATAEGGGSGSAPTVQEIDAQLSATHGAGMWGGAAGSGAIQWTYTLTRADNGVPIPDALVWVTSDQAGQNVLASGRTDQSGNVTFYLNAGMVYVWAQKSGWNFNNPDQEVVS